MLPATLEGARAHSCLDGLDPLVLLLLHGGQDQVHHMVSLNHPTICLHFAGFDELLLVIRDIKLKAVRFLGVIHLSDAQILQGDDSSGLPVCRLLKIVEAVVYED